MAKADLTAQRLRQLLDYDLQSGTFTWKVARGRQRAGAIANFVNHHGYVEICIDGRSYRAHRLAWLYVFGHWPTGDLDHANGIKNDNRLNNLREVTHMVNMQNVIKPRSHNRSGLLGVCLCKRDNRWIASIGVAGKVKRLGRFDTAELAHEAYLKAKRDLHGGCTI